MNPTSKNASLSSSVRPATTAPDERENGEAENSKRSVVTVGRIVKFLILAAIVGVLAYFYQRGDLTQENLKQMGAALPTAIFLPAFLLLPMVGVPISIVLLASGMKYGLGWSIAICAGGMAFHTLAAWYLTHSFFRPKVEGWLESTRFRLPTIPEKHQIWFTSLFVTVPGLPYIVKLYSLALTNLPFHRYFLIVWLFHVLNAIPLIAIGIAAIHLNPLWLSAFGVLAVLTVLGTHWLKKRFSDSFETMESNGSTNTAD